MVRNLEADYESESLFPARMEDWVGPRHLARFVREFVSMLDLEALGFTSSPRLTGRPRLSPALLVSAWLYGYLTRQKSTRALERACMTDLGAIWLTGNLQPDHSTLGNFFRTHRSSFKKLLKESALLGCRMGLVDLEFVAVDGSKLRACASGEGSLKAKDLEIALSSLDAEIERYMAAVETAGDSACEQLPESLSDPRLLREAMSRDMKELRELGISQFVPTDPDARAMKTTGGIRPAYNVQAAVDSLSGIVVACGVSQDANDSDLLDEALSEVESNLGVRPALTAADTGYFSGEQIALSQQKGRNVAIGMRGRAPSPKEPLHAWRFQYDRIQDRMLCPVGGELLFRGPGLAHGGKDPVRRFHCQEFWCCPYAQSCSKDERGRIVEAGEHRDAVLRQWERQKKTDHRANMKRRSATVERVFGHVKRNLGLRNLEHRGKEMVEAVWATALTVTNLQTFYRIWKRATA